MKKRIIYKDEPMGKPKVIKDFLPPPEDLIFKEDMVKVTLSLSRKSVEFFKKHAAKRRTPYQRMIRSLVDYYVTQAE